MKTKTLLLAIAAMMTLGVSAQSDYSNYLNKAMEKLDAGDCSAAKKLYNVYKELSKDTIISFEALIEDCGNDTIKTYAVGDKIFIKKDIYKVAYVEDGGKHGFAVCEIGSDTLKSEYLSQRLIPTWSEFLCIAENNKILKLEGQYWTSRADGSYTSGNYYYIFGLNGLSSGPAHKYTKYGILLTYRF